MPLPEFFIIAMEVGSIAIYILAMTLFYNGKALETLLAIIFGVAIAYILLMNHSVLPAVWIFAVPS